MIRNANFTFYRGRYLFILLLFLLGVLGLVWRLLYLTTIDRDFLQQQGNQRTLRAVMMPAYRGMITDRNGEPLAVSTPVDSVWVDPQAFQPTANQLTRLAEILSIKASVITARVKQATNREFLYIVRGLNPVLGIKVRTLNIPGLYLRREFRRFYPEGEVTAHLLGFTNVDDQGQEGLELVYENWLRGAPGVRKVIRDRLGHVVSDLGILKPARAGRDLTLSIDRRIQYAAYQALDAAVNQFKARAGSIVVLDVNTGEVLAMVNTPSFNPNQRPILSQDSRYRNRAVTDVFEPGSVMKPFSVASALESGKFKPETRIDTYPGQMLLDGKVVRDIHARGVMTVTEVLKHSSNVGVTKMVLGLPLSNMRRFLARFGFGESTGSGFPGERDGSLVDYRVWRPFVTATLAFGYGVSVTPLQLAQAYATLATGGVHRSISLLRVEEASEEVRIVNPNIAHMLNRMLQSVIEDEDAGAALAQVHGYHVAGKTGTARILGPHGYEEKRHIATFVGFAPATHPRLVVAVVIHDPQEQAYYASQVAAPVFSTVMGSSLNFLNVPPDHLDVVEAQNTVASE